MDQKQNATCAATRAFIRRRRECGSSPPLSALAGFTDDARGAGARPNRMVTAKVRATANEVTRQSAGRMRRAGSSGGLIMPTTNGAAHHANRMPSAEAQAASKALSIRTS
jgi:hypothetical protein